MTDVEHNTPSISAPSRNSLGIPIAIVIAAGLIAAAIYFSNSSTPVPTAGDQANPDQVTPEVSIQPINENDHIQGNPNAPIVLIEYSDFDCPFCKNFHETMNRVMEEYGASGKVAWVYRHFPLESLHPNAPRIAAASECVAEQAGNDGFWKFADLIFGERGTNDPTDPSRLPEFAASAGADTTQFELCLNNDTFGSMVAASVDEAVAAGGRGTPHTLVFVGNEYVAPISGAQPYDVVKANIETILTQIEGGGITE